MKSWIMVVIVALFSGTVIAADKPAANISVKPDKTELKSKNYRLISGPISTEGMFKQDIVLKSSNYMLFPATEKKEEVILKSKNYKLVPGACNIEKDTLKSNKYQLNVTTFSILTK